MCSWPLFGFLLLAYCNFIAFCTMLHYVDYCVHYGTTVNSSASLLSTESLRLSLASVDNLECAVFAISQLVLARVIPLDKSCVRITPGCRVQYQAPPQSHNPDMADAYACRRAGKCMQLGFRGNRISNRVCPSYSMDRVPGRTPSVRVAPTTASPPSAYFPPVVPMPIAVLNES